MELGLTETTWIALWLVSGRQLQLQIHCLESWIIICLGIYNNHFHIKIEINGKEIIYNTGNWHSVCGLEKNPEELEYIINLSPDYAYQPVRIMIENLRTERKFDFSILPLVKVEMYYSILSKNIGAAVVSFFAFVFSLLIIFYYLFLKSQKIMVASPYVFVFRIVLQFVPSGFYDSDMQVLFRSASLRYQSSTSASYSLPLTMALFFPKELHESF